MFWLYLFLTFMVGCITGIIIGYKSGHIGANDDIKQKQLREMQQFRNRR